MKNYQFCRRQFNKTGLILFFVFMFICLTGYSQENDWRNIEHAVSVIPDEGY